VELFNTNAYISTPISDREATVTDPSWNTPAYLVESAALSLESNSAEQVLKPSSLSKLTRTRSQFLSISFQVYLSTRISVIIFLGETLTYLQLGFLVLELRQPGTAVGCYTQSQACGLKHCAASMQLDLDLSLLNSPAALSIKDYEQCLGDSEWQDILLKLSQSRRAYSALHRKESECLSLPTPTTYSKGSGSYRPAGSTRLEQKLREFIPKGQKLNPEVPGWIMGFPPGWTEQVLLDGGKAISMHLHTMQELGHICQDAENVTICMPEVCVPSKPLSQSKELSISTHSLRQGSLAPFLETKKLKSGIATYPKVEGIRDPDNYQHWRWGFYYEIKIGGIWRNRSKSVTAAKAPIIKQMLHEGASCDRILEFLG
jgi:hypothetical protein